MDSLHAYLRQIATDRMQQDPAHDLAHLDRVWTNAQLIAQKEKAADLRVVLAAAYLHDLVNLPKDAPNRAKASALSAQEAAPLLRNLGFNEAEISATTHAIAAHSFSAGIRPETIEAAILRDADRLDALGAVGIARTFLVSGAMGRALYDPGDPFAAKRSPDDGRWSLDHWQTKLLQLPSEMLTIKGRDLANERAEIMRGYLAQLAHEIGIDDTGNRTVKSF